ncbi:MAG TPA: histidine kinase [Patescibacteria group bacterium]|nr:histidine kinase [Patescibacteria group bacterium]
MERRLPSGTELGIALASAALALTYTHVQAPVPTAISAGVLVVTALLGALTGPDRPDRAGLLRASAACAVGVVAGSLPTGLLHASLLILVFAVGRALRVMQLERKAIEVRAAAAVAAERASIARDLHDVVAHSLGVVVVQVQAAERIMESNPAGARSALQAAAAVGRDALDEMHRMVGVMRGGGDRRAAQPALADLPALVEQARQSGIAVELRTEVEPGGPDLPPGIELAAYRIVQEALANASRHASGTRAGVTVTRRPDGLLVSVTDGGGRSHHLDGGGFGIEGMRERVALYGGTLDAGPGESGGFRVRAWLPIRPA